MGLAYGLPTPTELYTAVDELDLHTILKILRYEHQFTKATKTCALVIALKTLDRPDVSPSRARPIIRLLFGHDFTFEALSRNKWYEMLNTVVEQDIVCLSYHSLNVLHMQHRKKNLLHLAVFKENVPLVTMLIGYHANVNAEDSYGRVPLMYAMDRGNTHMVQLLLSNGATTKNYPEVIHSAICLRRRVLINTILDLDEQLDLNDAAADGQTALFILVGNPFRTQCKVEMLRKFLNKGADVNRQCRQGSTVLHMTVQDGDECMVERVLAAGADVNLKNNHQDTALHWAAVRGNERIGLMLLEAGVDICAVSDRQTRRTALQIAVEFERGKFVELMLSYGFDVFGKALSLVELVNIAKEKILLCNMRLTHPRKLRISTDIFDALEMHIIKLALLGLDIKLEDLKYFEEDLKAKPIVQLVRMEIEVLKQLPTKQLSYYHVLKVKRATLASYMRNEVTCTLLRSCSLTQFRYYKSWLRARLSLARVNASLRNSSAASLTVLMGRRCPSLVVEKVLEFLSDTDRKVLIQAVQDQ